MPEGARPPRGVLKKPRAETSGTSDAVKGFAGTACARRIRDYKLS